MVNTQKNSEKVIVQIDLPAKKVELYYAGRIHSVQAYTTSGVSVSLPMNILTNYVTPGGIFGTFEIEYADVGSQKKFVKIRKLR